MQLRSITPLMCLPLAWLACAEVDPERPADGAGADGDGAADEAATTAALTPYAIQTTTRRLVQTGSARCLTDNGGPVSVTDDCPALVQHKWTYQADLSVRSDLGRCLEAVALAATGGEVQARACSGQAAQQWRVRARGAGYEIYVTAPGGATLCLGVGGVGARAAYGACSGAAAQSWLGDHAPANAYLSLGDSYSAGTGAGSYVDRTCWNSWNSYSSTLNTRLAEVGKAGYQMAQGPSCNGARMADYWSRSQWPWRRPQRDYLTTLYSGAAYDPQNWSLVTITMGGNDVGFADFMSCIVSSDSCLARGEEAAIDARIDAVDFRGLYLDLVKRAPNAQVRILTYPYIYSAAAHQCTALGWLKDDEYAAMTRMADRLNGRIAAAAAAVGQVTGGRLRLVDVRPDFAGHGVCDAAPAINGVTYDPISLSFSESFHPNAFGHRLMGQALARTL